MEKDRNSEAAPSCCSSCCQRLIWELSCRVPMFSLEEPNGSILAVLGNFAPRRTSCFRIIFFGWSISTLIMIIGHPSASENDKDDANRISIIRGYWIWTITLLYQLTAAILPLVFKGAFSQLVVKKKKTGGDLKTVVSDSKTSASHSSLFTMVFGDNDAINTKAEEHTSSSDVDEHSSSSGSTSDASIDSIQYHSEGESVVGDEPNSDEITSSNSEWIDSYLGGGDQFQNESHSFDSSVEENSSIENDDSSSVVENTASYSNWLQMLLSGYGDDKTDDSSDSRLHSPTIWVKLMWVLYSIAAPVQIVAIALYWTVEFHIRFDDMNRVDLYLSLSTNIIVGILILIDGIVLSSIPVRIKHIIFPIIFFAGYFLWEYYHFKTSFVSSAIITYAITPVAYMFVWCLSVLRRRLTIDPEENEDEQHSVAGDNLC